jgi:hypothetical protein
MVHGRQPPRRRRTGLRRLLQRPDCRRQGRKQLRRPAQVQDGTTAAWTVCTLVAIEPSGLELRQASRRIGSGLLLGLAVATCGVGVAEVGQENGRPWRARCPRCPGGLLRPSQLYFRSSGSAAVALCDGVRTSPLRQLQPSADRSYGEPGRRWHQGTDEARHAGEQGTDDGVASSCGAEQTDPASRAAGGVQADWWCGQPGAVLERGPGCCVRRVAVAYGV